MRPALPVMFRQHFLGNCHGKKNCISPLLLLLFSPCKEYPIVCERRLARAICRSLLLGMPWRSLAAHTARWGKKGNVPRAERLGVCHRDCEKPAGNNHLQDA